MVKIVRKSFNTPKKLSVFISYASEDVEHARNISLSLGSEGYDPWFDKDKLLPGSDWKLEIEKAVENCDAIVICLSRLSMNKRGFVQKEIKKALDIAEEQPEGEIFIIPCRLEPCDIPHSLKNKQWADLFEEGGLKKLLSGLQMKAESMGINVNKEKSDDELIGEYFASGNNDDGTDYSGRVIISKYKEHYLVTWYIAGEHFSANGYRDGKKLTVKGDFDFTYEIDNDGNMSGEWEEGAFERLVKEGKFIKT